jgi:hypothetical protein
VEKGEVTERYHYLVMDFITLFLVVSVFFTASAQQMESNVSRGSSLTPTTNLTWLSHSGLYAFGFYKQGDDYSVGIFIAGIPEKTVVWTATRDGPLSPAMLPCVSQAMAGLSLKWHKSG